MRYADTWFREGVWWGVTLVVVVAALPLFALATVLVRAVLLPLAIGGLLLSVVLYGASGRFRGWANGLMTGHGRGWRVTT